MRSEPHVRCSGAPRSRSTRTRSRPRSTWSSSTMTASSPRCHRQEVQRVEPPLVELPADEDLRRLHHRRVAARGRGSSRGRGARRRDRSRSSPRRSGGTRPKYTPVGEADDVGREPVAPDMRGLPHLLDTGVEQGSHHRSPEVARSTGRAGRSCRRDGRRPVPARRYPGGSSPSRASRSMSSS